MIKLKSHVDINYVEMPLIIFASKYPKEFFKFTTTGMLPKNSVFDNRYIVRLQIDSSGIRAIEIGWGSDDWNIK